jgi:hypothetical protein
MYQRKKTTHNPTQTNKKGLYVEEVLAHFQVKLMPVSAGSPQEMAFAESKVRVIKRMSTAMLLTIYEPYHVEIVRKQKQLILQNDPLLVLEANQIVGNLLPNTVDSKPG